ncbi:hypothetical protein FBU31_005069 [Coemansia sp. 'formosensis']|nr:hypothetical protein FBU31_005069 [Coemansia sp. 'formosensis']
MDCSTRRNGKKLRVSAVILCSMAAAVSAAPAIGLAPRILGGNTVTSNMFPFIVHLFKDGNPYCGGTLISKDWVITAAHCVADKDTSGSGAGAFVVSDPSSFKVGYGTNGGSLTNSVDVVSINVNAGFDPVWYTSDIALLKIKSTSDLVAKAQPLGISTANISAGQKVTTAGWGQSSNDNTAQSNSLQFAQLITAEDAVCKLGATDWNGQNGRYVCTSYAATPKIGTCFGDSGGPLLMSSGNGYALLGLVSFDVNTQDSSNTKCAQVGNVSYFTRVSSYVSYISSVTGIADKTLIGGSAPWSHDSGAPSSPPAAPSSSSTPDGDVKDVADSSSSTTTTTTSSTSSTTSSTASSSSTNGSSSKPSSKSSSSSSSPANKNNGNSVSSTKPTHKSSGSVTDMGDDSGNKSDDRDEDAEDINSESQSGSGSSTSKHSSASVVRLVPASVGLLVGVIAALY